MNQYESHLDSCRLLDFPKIYDARGSLTFIEGTVHIPFEIKRVYYLYDVPGGETRAGHAHRHLQQVLIAMSGSFDVKLDDGSRQCKYSLNRSYFGLYVSSLIWREIDNFSSGAVCMALASAPYVESDYIRKYQDYCTLMRSKR